MKTKALHIALLLLICLPFTSFSTGCDPCSDDLVLGFELNSCSALDYMNYGAITPQSSAWRLWRSGSGDAEVKYRSDLGTYLNIDEMNGRRTDVVFDLGKKTSGLHRVEWEMYVPRGYAGYYNIQHGNRGESDASWAVQVWFYTNGTGIVLAGNNRTEIANFQYQQSEWLDILHHYDVFNDQMELWIDGKKVVEWEYSRYNNNKTLGAINFHSPDSRYDFAVKNICSSERSFFINCSDIYLPVCVDGETFTNDCYAMDAGYSEKEWTDGACGNSRGGTCLDCGSCFEYTWEDDYCHFKSPQCPSTGGPYVIQVTPTYEWTFPAGSLKGYEQGTDRFSADPICRLYPGEWTICRKVIYPEHGTFECCITVVVNPSNCKELPPICGLTYSNSGYRFNFDASSSQNVQEYSWVIEDTETGAYIGHNFGGKSSVRSVDFSEYAGKCLLVTVFTSNCYGFSKRTIKICVPSHGCRPLPPTCGIITPTYQDDIVSCTGIPTGWDDYEWMVPSEIDFVSGNSTSKNPRFRIPKTGRYTVCLILKYECSTLCVCFTVGHGCCGGNQYDDVIIDVDEYDCAEAGKLVRIPIIVRNFEDIDAFNFSINLDDNQAGELIDIEGENIGNRLVSANVINSRQGVISWSHTHEVSLPNNFIIGYLIIRASDNYKSQTTIRVSGVPQVINVRQAGKTASVRTFGGTLEVCEQSSMNICGRIHREDGMGVKDVLVNITNQANGNTIIVQTDQNGEYCAIVDQGSYRVFPEKNTDHNNGVDVRDVALINSHVIFSSRFNNPYKSISADISHDDQVFASDVSELLKLVLGMNNQFQNNTSWRFVDEKKKYQDGNNPFREGIPEYIDISSDNYKVDFIAMKIGDVNNDNDPSNLNEDINQIRSASDLKLEFMKPHQKSNGLVVLPVALINQNDVDNLFNLQFSANWDVKSLNVVDIDIEYSELEMNTDNFNTTGISEGILSFAWYDQEGLGISINDTTVLFELVLKLNEQKSQHEISFDNEPVEMKAGSFSEVLSIEGSSYQIKLSTAVHNLTHEIDFSTYPNPCTDFIHLEWEDNDFEIMKLEIIGMSGKLVWSEENNYNSEININTAFLSSGQYMIRAINNNGYILQPFVKL